MVGRTTADGKWIKQEFFYEPGTRRLQNVRAATRTAGTLNYITDTTYSYDAVGHVLKASDAPVGATADHQCFTYDYLNRLTEAWTPGNGDCDAVRSVGALGGPAKYWNSWTFDTTGNRRTEVVHAAGGDTTSTYTYPAAGQPQPHTLTQVKTVGPAGTKTIAYGYDKTGNTTSRPGTGANRQTLTWDAEGHLEKVDENGVVSTFVYDADGNRLARRDGSGTTVYLPGMELNSTGGSNKTATRFYTHGDQTVGVRTNDNKLTWQLADNHGTNTVTVDATSQTLQRRYSTPFGGDRGAAPTFWPDDKGFVGGTKDGTGLTHLGAREYDPQTGRFISVDPIIDPSDPQQMHGYAYASNSPTSYVDATGLRELCGHGRHPAHASADRQRPRQRQGGEGAGGSGQEEVPARHDQGAGPGVPARLLRHHRHHQLLHQGRHRRLRPDPGRTDPLGQGLQGRQGDHVRNQPGFQDVQGMAEGDPAGGAGHRPSRRSHRRTAEESRRDRRGTVKRTV
ncbi:RHS repeat-associated core domain-containing protein [Micromonospora zhanjiangensis]